MKEIARQDILMAENHHGDAIPREPRFEQVISKTPKKEIGADSSGSALGII
jgi:hypothetical protein